MVEIVQPALFGDVPEVVAGFSTRKGGVSQPPYDALNLGLSTADEEDAVIENRRRLFGQVGFEVNEVAIAGQVHGTDVLPVERPGLYSGYDGLVSNTRGPSPAGMTSSYNASMNISQ